MKKITFVVLFFSIINFVQAQDKGKFRVGLDAGIVLGSGKGGGGGFGLEPKYNLKDNLNVGLRFQGAGMFKDLYYIDEQRDEYNTKEMTSFSFVATSDYYYSKSEKRGSFAPFVGGGLGLYSVKNVYYTADQLDADNAYNTKANSVLGGMIRTGFEWGKFRLTAEYNFVPKTDLQDYYGNVIGREKNNYFGLTIGFYLGGGKWRR